MSALLALLLAAAAPVATAAPRLAPAAPLQQAAEPDFQRLAESVEPLVVRLTRPLNWPGIRYREALISFPPAAARAAAEELDDGLLDPVRRAAALMAIGSTELPGGRSRLESWAVGGGALERRAAVLALGEMGAEGLVLLRQLAGAADPDLAEAALLALLRMESPAIRDEVEAMAADATFPNAQVAQRALDFLNDPLDAEVPDSVKLLFELRWEAAMLYGRIGGKSWGQLRVEELENDERFLRAVVLRVAADLTLPGAQDHLLALVRDDPEPATLRAAVARFPLLLGRDFEEGELKPRNRREWEAVLDGLEDAGYPREGYVLARAASEVEGLEVRAATTRLAMGDETAPLEVQAALFGPERQERLRLVRALGRSADPRWVGELTKLRSDPDPEVATAALVAQMRMGYRPADDVVRSIVLDGEEADRDRLCVELLEHQGDPRTHALLEAALPQLVGRTRLRAAAALARIGRVLPRRALRAALDTGVEADLTPELVRALGVSPSHTDLELLARIYPHADREANLALAEVLVRQDHPLGLGLLDHAIWYAPLDQSALAAGLLVRSRGVDALQLLLDSPSGPVSAGDLRKVGFALGEWGGVPALEELARRRPSSDPALQGAYLGAMSARTH